MISKALKTSKSWRQVAKERAREPHTCCFARIKASYMRSSRFSTNVLLRCTWRGTLVATFQKE